MQRASLQVRIASKHFPIFVAGHERDRFTFSASIQSQQRVSNAFTDFGGADLGETFADLLLVKVSCVEASAVPI